MYANCTNHSNVTKESNMFIRVFVPFASFVVKIFGLFHKRKGHAKINLNKRRFLAAFCYSLFPILQLVQGIYVGLGARYNDVRIRAVARYLLAVFLDLHGHLTEGIGTTGYALYEISIELALGARDRSNSPVHSIDGAVTLTCLLNTLATYLHFHSRRRRNACTALGTEVLERIYFLDLLHLIGDDRFEIFVEDLFFLVCDPFEPLEGFIQVIIR